MDKEINKDEVLKISREDIIEVIQDIIKGMSIDNMARSGEFLIFSRAEFDSLLIRIMFLTQRQLEKGKDKTWIKN